MSEIRGVKIASGAPLVRRLRAIGRFCGAVISPRARNERGMLGGMDPVGPASPGAGGKMMSCARSSGLTRDATGRAEAEDAGG